MQHGFIKLASAALPIRVADCVYNAALAVEAIEAAAQRQVKILTLPELCLTGAACGDLFLHAPLLRGALEALETVRAATASHPGLLVVVGLPVALGGSVSVGLLTSFLSYANQYTKPFNEISGVVTELQNAIACAARLLELINEPAQSPDPENARVLADVDGSVSCENVSFSYTPPMISRPSAFFIMFLML